MLKLAKIAIRNLFRYKRRTLLTVSLITVGVIFVLVFVSVSNSFKGMIIGEITDSMLGHMQIHRKGYVASIDNLPLNITLQPKAYKRLEQILKKIPEIESYSPRIKFGGVFSNFVESTNIRLNAVYPEKEFSTVPLLSSRIISGKKEIELGEILVPELLTKGMKVKVGNTVVIVATNKDGSVNGYQFKVGGILRSVTGPGGRDGYIHIEDGRQLLRMDEQEISEVAVRLKNFNRLDEVSRDLELLMSNEVNEKRQPLFEIHTWEKLSPFYNIARMINIMTFFIKLMLIAIVLISIMNVMIMAVYERTKEIGTMAAIGTLPGRILSMFIIEGLCMGITGSFTGSFFGAAIVVIINISRVTFNFGRQKGLILSTGINPIDVLTISAIVIVVAALASFRPAYRASKMDPIKAIIHV